ncbi:MAG: response regulator transcription factor [Nannocystaceae bacterium]|nr:response regulator transcription factor [Nannocystaceae bacterium]
MNLLIVDDDDELCSLLRTALARDGHATRTAASITMAREALLEASFDVVVLDLGLPDGDGLHLCRALRADGSSVAILILTAAGNVRARVDGLDAGADDYLVKPFAIAELRARVRALGRRGTQPLVARCTRGDVELDFAARRAKRAGLDVALTAKEWAILEAIARADGGVVPRDVLLAHVWGAPSDSANASLGVLLARIRHKLGRSLLRTLRGKGHALG